MKRKSILAIFLAVLMTLSMMTFTAFAADGVDSDTKTITVTTPAQLKDLADYSNDASAAERDYPKNFSGWTIIVAADLDMSAITNWKPFLNFYGSMTGKIGDVEMATISNLTVTAANNVGLCGNSANGTFSNLTIKNSSFTVTGTSKDNSYGGAFSANGFTSKFTNCHIVDTVVTASRFVGGITGSCYGNITGCTATGAKTIITAKTTGLFASYIYSDNAGGIVGLYCENLHTISGCKVDGITVTGARQLGGIAGAVLYGSIVENCEVSNSKIVSTATNYATDATPCAGGVVGQLAATSPNETIIIRNNKVTDTSVTQKYTKTVYTGWAVGDADTRLADGVYEIYGNVYVGETTLNEVGYNPANPSSAN